MKNQEFIHSEYPKCCYYCEKGILSFDKTAVLCEKFGIMETDDCCKKFIYDPLKRIPLEKPSALTQFTVEDFSL